MPLRHGRFVVSPHSLRAGPEGFEPPPGRVRTGYAAVKHHSPVCFVSLKNSQQADSELTGELLGWKQVCFPLHHRLVLQLPPPSTRYKKSPVRHRASNAKQVWWCRIRKRHDCRNLQASSVADRQDSHCQVAYPSRKTARNSGLQNCQAVSVHSLHSRDTNRISFSLSLYCLLPVIPWLGIRYTHLDETNHEWFAQIPSLLPASHAGEHLRGFTVRVQARSASEWARMSAHSLARRACILAPFRGRPMSCHYLYRRPSNPANPENKADWNRTNTTIRGPSYKLKAKSRSGR